MDATSLVLAQFDHYRPRLTSIAFRMLGSDADAEDAVQEAWLRVARADAADVDNVPGWLTTVTARVCLNMLRTRTARREDPFDHVVYDALPQAGAGPEDEAAPHRRVTRTWRSPWSGRRRAGRTNPTAVLGCGPW